MNILYFITLMVRQQKNLKYKITASNGQVYQGTSDENGKTKMCNSDSMESLKIEIFTDE